MLKSNLGRLLRTARTKKGLSQKDVANYLNLKSAQSVSDWERNHGSGVPLPSLKKLVRLYGLKSDSVFKTLLNQESQKLEADLRRKFYRR